MVDYLNGWKNKADVYIPPVKQKGFKENVIIRKQIEPRRAPANVYHTESDKLTIYGKSNAQNQNDEPTVLLNQKVKKQLYVQRLKTGEKVEVKKDPFIIGKGSDSDFIIYNNPTISRRHLQIRKIEEEYVMNDMNSSNHTYLDGKQMNQPMIIKDEMIVCLSDEEFQFSVVVE